MSTSRRTRPTSSRRASPSRHAAFPTLPVPEDRMVGPPRSGSLNPPRPNLARVLGPGRPGWPTPASGSTCSRASSYTSPPRPPRATCAPTIATSPQPRNRPTSSTPRPHREGSHHAPTDPTCDVLHQPTPAAPRRLEHLPARRLVYLTGTIRSTSPSQQALARPSSRGLTKTLRNRLPRAPEADPGNDAALARSTPKHALTRAFASG